MVTTLVKIVMLSFDSSSLDDPSVSSTSLPSLSKSRRVLLLLAVRVAEKENKEEDVYFFEVNTKYISSNVMKISVNSRVHSTIEIADLSQHSGFYGTKT